MAIALAPSDTATCVIVGSCSDNRGTWNKEVVLDHYLHERRLRNKYSKMSFTRLGVVIVFSPLLCPSAPALRPQVYTLFEHQKTE